MSRHPTLRHFKKGISLTSQWTGTEHKNMEKVFLGVIAGVADERVIAAAHSMLDFIYYAHFETHTDKSLAQLDAAWLRFHENKNIFKDLKIPDGFNTEGSERLHIDLAKRGYNASNKKEYVKQMTYLQWAILGYIAALDGDKEEGTDKEGDEADDMVEDDLGERENKDDGREEESQASPQVSMSIAKKPAIVGAAVNKIIDQFGATDFLWYIEDFLQKAAPSAVTSLTTSTTFDIYKHLVLTLPPIAEVSSDPIQDVVHATLSRPQNIPTTNGIVKAAPPRFSTVLACYGNGVGEKGPLAGIRAAQVRFIFKLPESFNYPHLLAFVYWYKPFHVLTSTTGFHTISLSIRSQRQHSAVIPASDILRTCHLIPAFGRHRAASLGWTPDHILQQSDTFYLNPYLRHYDFFLL